ncbi:hypothetical protein NHF46_13645 [Arthrobacter alpinus]|nr:hypothetical protein [Arthrobacter alpinus]
MSRTQAVNSTHTAAPPVRDLRRFWRIGAAVLIPLGPLGVTIGRGIMPYWTDQSPRPSWTRSWPTRTPSPR